MKIIFFLLLILSSLMSYSQKEPGSAYFRKADSLIKNSNWKDAAQALETGLSSNENNGLAWFRLAAVYQNLENYKKSIESYNKSLLYPSPTVPPVIIRASLAKVYALNHDSTGTFRVLADMLGNGYRNFQSLLTDPEYSWLRSSPSFAKIIDAARINAYPCLNNPRNREFDFWQGAWNVFQSGSDYQVGKSVIELKSGSCLILENWTATGGLDEGKSMNYFNTKNNKWEQVYMGISGVPQNYYNGEYRDGAMRFDGDGVTKTGGKMLFHLSYFNQSKDQVRQLLEQSADEGKTWTTLYDFTYKRIHE